MTPHAIEMKSTTSINESNAVKIEEDDDDVLRRRNSNSASKLAAMSAAAAQNRFIDPIVLSKDENISMEDIQYLVSRGILEMRKVQALNGVERIRGGSWDNIYDKLVNLDQEIQYIYQQTRKLCGNDIKPEVINTFDSIIKSALEQALKSDTYGSVRIIMINNKPYIILTDLSTWQSRMGGNLVLLMKTNIRTGVTASFQSMSNAATALKFSNPEDFMYLIDSGAIHKNKIGHSHEGILTTIIMIDALATLEEILVEVDSDTVHSLITSLGLGEAIVNGSAIQLCKKYQLRILQWRKESVIVIAFFDEALIK